MFGAVRRCLLAPGLFVLLLPGGCMYIFNPMPDPPSDAKQLSEQLPCFSRDGVYIFLINGADPLDCGNFYSIRDFLNKLGFLRSYYGECCQGSWLVDEIKLLHKEKPKARIVVIGYGLGADAALEIAEAGAKAGASIDMLMYLEPRGFSFKQVPDTNNDIRKVVVVRRETEHPHDSEIRGAEVISTSGWCRHLVPTHPATLDAIATELTNLAMLVPVPNPPAETFPKILDDPAPTPRPLEAAKPAPRDEWDFLKLVSREKGSPEEKSKVQQQHELPRLPGNQTEQLPRPREIRKEVPQLEDPPPLKDTTRSGKEEGTRTREIPGPQLADPSPANGTNRSAKKLLPPGEKLDPKLSDPPPLNVNNRSTRDVLAPRGNPDPLLAEPPPLDSKTGSGK